MSIIVSTEDKILIACCKHVAGLMSAHKLHHELLRLPINEHKLFMRAAHHRIQLIVNRFLIQAHPEYFTKTLIDKFHQKNILLIIQQLDITRLLCEIHQILLQAQIPHVFLKGPTLGQQLFNKQALRQCNDIDVLIPVSYLLTAHRCLNLANFSTEHSEQQLQYWLNTQRFHTVKDVSYYHPSSKFRVELHWKTDHIEHLVKHDYFDWDQQCVHLEFQNFNIPILKPLTNVLYLCAHATRHGWSRARWLFDILLFIRKYNIDMNELLEAASTHDLKHVVEEACYLLTHWFDLECYAPFAKADSIKKTALLKRHRLEQKNKHNVFDKMRRYWYRGNLQTSWQQKYQLRFNLLASAFKRQVF